MSTPFLHGFSRAVVDALLAEGLLEVADGARDRVIAHAARVLAEAEHRSLVSTLAGALVGCPETLELYADDEQLKQLIQDLGRRT